MLKSIAGFILSFLIMFYVCGFLAPFLHFGKFPRVVEKMNTGTLYESICSQIDAGSSIFLMLVLCLFFIILLTKAFSNIKKWITKNIELAKQGVTVKKDWDTKR